MISRNSPCPCGSGKRFKNCCGVPIKNNTLPANNVVRDIMRAAMSNQLANRLKEAEDLYRQLLALAPDEPHCLHMLGVVHLQTDRPHEAVRLILKAAVLTGWKLPGIQHNMRLALGNALKPESARYTLARRIAYRMWCQQRAAGKTMRQPLVSVIIPSYNHDAYITDCLDSVYEQTYRPIELIIIDDGSKDDTPALIKKKLHDCPFPNRFIARENRGAHATINEGVALAQGEYFNILNSDDRFSPDRIQRMVEEVACSGSDWGFSNVQIIDDAGVTVKNPVPGSRAADLEKKLAEGPRFTTLGFGLLKANFAITSGNFFISRALFQRLGGFSNLRYNHDWEFALRATQESEPVYVPGKLYFYRLHGHNTISESSSGPKLEAMELLSTYLQANCLPPPNPFAPCKAYWGDYYLAEECRIGSFVDRQTSDHRPLAQLAQRLINHDREPARSLPSISSLDFLAALPDVGKILDYMADDDLPEEYPFDQAQRYRVTAMAIEQLRHPGRTFTILEVGANRHRRLSTMLPRDKIVYLDMEVPEEMKGDADIIEGDATALGFPDGHFDVVVALDVLEHIPAEKRKDFLRHTTRVARLMTVIAAPFDDPQVRAAEADALAFWDQLMPTPYRWLTEHAVCGLPDLAETQLALTEIGVHHRSIGHGHLELWGDMLKGHFSAEAMPELRPAIRALDTLYGKYFLTQDFSDVSCYRHFIFCSPGLDKVESVVNHFASLPESLLPFEHIGLDAIHQVLAMIRQLAFDSVRKTSV